MALESRTTVRARSPGLVASFRQFFTTLVVALHTRAELIAHELQRERMRVTRLAILGAVALLFFGLGMLTLTMFIIVLFWDSQRLVAIGFVTLLYLGIAVAAALTAKREAAKSLMPFAATLEQLKKDREQFLSKNT